MKLTGKDKVYLRGLGHNLKPIIQIGKEGVSEEFAANLEDCLDQHELLKIKILENAPGDKKALAAEVEKATGGSVVQIIGKTLTLYRPFREEPGIALPSK